MPLRSQPFVPGVIASSRYRNTLHILRNDGREIVTVRKPVDTSLRIDDLYHVWGDGDFLDMLALRYYNDPTLWWVIADFNQITEMRVIEVGRRLRLPNLRRLTLEILT